MQKNPHTQQEKATYNPQNIVDDSEWVTHYQWNNILLEPIIYIESFQDIRKRTQT